MVSDSTRLRPMPLVDERLVAQTFAMRREVQHPRLLSNEPVIRDAQAYGSVLRDGSGQWRMWYLADPDYCEYYATSADGLNWQFPELDLVSPQVRRLSARNAFMSVNQKDAQGRWLVGTRGPEGFCVLDATMTPHPAARARFTALYLARTETESGMYIAHSEDGVRWLAGEGNPVIAGWRDTSSALLYDPRRGRYRWYGRPHVYAARELHANRLLACRESEDLIHWTPDRTILDTDDADADPYSLLDEAAMRSGKDAISAAERAAAWAALTEGQRSDQDKPIIRGRNRQFYGLTPFLCTDIHLGIDWMYDLPSGEMWTELVRSVDGLEWRREVVRAPFIPRVPGACTSTMASPPVAVGDEVWIYDSIINRTHHALPDPHAERSIRALALRRDRWVGYVAGESVGELLTQVMERPHALEINAATEGDGWLRVEAIDAEGRPLEGLTAEECEPISGDRLDFAPLWRSGRTIADVDAAVIRLRIHARRAALFALYG